MNKFNLACFTSQFLILNRAYTKGLGKAPHKPVLLLVILEMVKVGDLLSNRVIYDGVFVGHFRNQWKRLVNSGHTPNSALPFFHMRSERKPTFYWRLVIKPGMDIPITSSHSIKSPRALEESLEYAEIDLGLYYLMADPVANEVLRKSLLEHYFPRAESASNIQYNIFDQIHNEIVAERKVDYAEHLKKLEASLKPEEFHEEVIVRSAVFRKDVLKVYDDTCSVSGLYVTTVGGAQLLDACHIVPFSESRKDHITNGICLSPTLHRAFDRGLAFIDDNYRFQLRSDISERESFHALSLIKNVSLKLPENKLYWPSREALLRHRQLTGND